MKLPRRRRTAQSAEFERFFSNTSSALLRTLSRAAATDPLVGEIVRDTLAVPNANVTLRLLGGAHYLVLSGRAPAYAELEDPWPVFHGILEQHTDWLRDFVETQPVQTNEVQRAWTLLPGFLAVVRDWRGPIDLLELGPSAGLNLLWDRYTYSYAAGSWGPESAELSLAGEETTPVPHDLLTGEAAVRRRVGIDQNPVDVFSQHGARLLEAFVPADDPEALDRVRRAIAVARRDRPTLIAGDYVDLAPELLAQRDSDALTIVFSSISTEYLEDESYATLVQGIEATTARGPLAWVSAERARDAHKALPYVLEVQTWPGGQRVRLANVHYNGTSLRWL